MAAAADEVSLTLVDRLVAYVNPRAGLARYWQRRMLARAYEGASLRDGWRPKRAGASANTDHAMDAGTLRARARSLVQNVPYMAQAMRSLTANTVGTGIVPRSLAAGGEEIDALWREWTPVADADGRLDINGLVSLAYRTMEIDGEVLVRLRPRRPADGLPVPLQIQVLEIDWLDSLKTVRRGTNQIINGIEYDPLGRVVAYWLFDQHPGDLSIPLRGTVRRDSHPVPAESVIHLYNPERPGQGRGFSRLAPVISRVRDLQLLEDAEGARKNLETRLAVLVSGAADQDVLPSVSGTAPGAAADAGMSTMGELGSGHIIRVGDGVNVTAVEPKAAPGHVDHVKYQLHIIAAGLGVTYEMMIGDMGDTNFSSARVRQQDFRREVEIMQWQVLIPRLVDRVWHAFIDAAVLDGRLRIADYRVDYSTPKWAYINPQQDVAADCDEIAAGLSSLSEKLRQRGYDPKLVLTEAAADVALLRELGLLEVLPFFRVAGNAGGTAQG